MFRRLFALVTTAACAAVAVGGPQTYASRVQPIRAGIVVLDSSPQVVSPFAFYNLSVNTGVRPVGWDVYNPHAPARVTSDIIARFGPSPGLNKNPAPLGTQITKRDAPYWEVYLDNATSSDLGDYDILLVAPGQYASVTPAEREKLRSFVDHGGILWIDPSALPYNNAGIDPGNNFPVAFMTRSITAATTDQFDYTHPLLSRPFALSANDVSILNGGLPATPLRGAIDSIKPGRDLGTGAYNQFYGSDIASFTTLRPVTLAVTGGPTGTVNETMGVAHIGDGFVVVTARGASLKLNRVALSGLNYTTNSGYTAILPAILEQDGQAAAKLVVNMISMLSEYRQEGSGAHKSGGSAITMDAPLLNRSHDTSFTFDNPTTSTYGAVIYKGMVIASIKDGTGFSRLVAYDANPKRDLDEDGNPDDGQVDLNPGSGSDIVWQSPNLTGPISMPVVAEVPDSLVGADQVLVVDGTGVLHAYNPVARTPDGRHLLGDVRVDLFTPIQPPRGVMSVGDTPAPPTVHEGLAYIAENYSKTGTTAGRLWVANLRTGKAMTTTLPWYLGGSISPFQAQPYAASPTVAYIPILDNSGGSDKVLYAPMKRDLQAQSPAGVQSIWLGSRSEKPLNAPTVQSDGTNSVLQIETRASQQGSLPVYVRPGIDPLNPKLVVLQNGVPWTTSQMTSVFDGSVSESGGVLSFGLKGGTFPTDAQVRLDYNIDWGDPSFQGVAESIKRGFLQVPEPPANPSREITGPVALTAKGTIYFSVSGGQTAALFGFREEGRGNFRCVMRYELYPGFNFNPQGQATDKYPTLLEDHDPVINFNLTALGGPITAYQIVGAPAVRNDQVFITAHVQKSAVIFGTTTNVDATVLMAFRSEPESPRFIVDSVPDGTVIVQPDVARSAIGLSKTTADVPTVIPSSGYEWDPDSHVMRLDSLMNIQKGQIQQCLSLSQPLYLRTPGGADTLLVPDNQGGASWSPLLWYSVLNGYTPETGPVVTGDTLFVGGRSILPSLLNGGPIVPVGLLYAMRAQIDPSDGFLIITPGRNWLKQLWTLKDSGGLEPNPDVKWPQMSGITSVSDFQVHLNQTLLNGSSDVLGIAGGDGSLVALGSHGLYTYNRSDLVIADANRLMLVDAAGNPVWSTTSTADAGQTGSAAVVHALVHPTRAYRLNESDLLVVDSGANRVFRMNLGGVETRSISSFTLDPNFRPSGYPANGPLTLNDPRDVATYSNVVYYPEAGGPSLGDSESATGFEYWEHYLIADSGNHRLVEVIDRYAYDINNQRILGPIKIDGIPQIGVLFWHSPAVVSGKQFAYHSIVRTELPTGQFVYVAGLGSVMPTAADTGGAVPAPGDLRNTSFGNGGIVIFDPLNPNVPVVVNSMSVPAQGQNVFWNDAAGMFLSPAVPLTTRFFSNVTSVSTSVGVGGSGYVIRIMVTDATGVYELNYLPGVSVSGAPLSVNWMLLNNVYRNLRFDITTGKPDLSNARTLKAVYAQRVDDDNVLIVNGYNGQTLRGDPFVGEVLQIDGNPPNYTRANFGFSTGSISLRLSTIAGTRGLVLPVFANRG